MLGVLQLFLLCSCVNGYQWGESMTEERDKKSLDEDLSYEVKVLVVIAETLIEIRDGLKDMRKKEEILRSASNDITKPTYLFAELLTDIRNTLVSIDKKLGDSPKKRNKKGSGPR